MPLGDNETVATLEERAGRELKLPYEDTNRPVAKKRRVGKKPTASPKARDDSSAVDFLKSRPQIARLQEDFTKHQRLTKKPRVRTVAGEEASDLVAIDHFKGRADAWQQDESILDFLRRLPVGDPGTAKVGPWLWVSSSQISRSHQEQRGKADPDTFIDLGEDLKRAFISKRSQTEAENPGKAQATISRKMGPYRDQLEEDLLSAAVKTYTTCGKWMLFPSSTELPRYWRVVAEATSEGKLGPVSKAATYDPYDGKDETLICAYTYDFTDIVDVRRVLDELVELDLCRRDGKGIFYKCDAYTYMGIVSNNEFKLRASLYSSAELFKEEAKPLKDGPIARLKKRNQTIDSFVTS